MVLFHRLIISPFDNVFCVLSFHFNLISISKLTCSSNCFLVFHFFLIQDLTSRKMIGKGEECNGLYFVLSDATICNSTLSISWVDVYHRQLGHLSSKNLNLLSYLVFRINVSAIDYCNIFPLAKQSRLPFSHNSIYTHAIFEIIHCNIWGHHHMESIFCAQYFLAIIDDYSCRT